MKFQYDSWGRKLCKGNCPLFFRYKNNDGPGCNAKLMYLDKFCNIPKGFEVIKSTDELTHEERRELVVECLNKGNVEEACVFLQNILADLRYNLITRNL